jgi:hypothetical protein
MADADKATVTTTDAAPKTGQAKVETEIKTDAVEVVQAAETKTAAIRAAVDKWVATELSNSPLSRATPAFNHVRSKLGALVQLIEKEV